MGLSDEQFGFLLLTLTGFGCLFVGLTAAVKRLPETSLMFTALGLVTVIGTTIIWVLRS
jgi:uncharacterized protein YjeT (DUF2065 family)